MQSFGCCFIPALPYGGSQVKIVGTSRRSPLDEEALAAVDSRDFTTMVDLVLRNKGTSNLHTTYQLHTSNVFPDKFYLWFSHQRYLFGLLNDTLNLLRIKSIFLKILEGLRHYALSKLTDNGSFLYVLGKNELKLFIVVFGHFCSLMVIF